MRSFKSETEDIEVDQLSYFIHSFIFYATHFPYKAMFRGEEWGSQDTWSCFKEPVKRFHVNILHQFDLNFCDPGVAVFKS